MLGLTLVNLGEFIHEDLEGTRILFEGVHDVGQLLLGLALPLCDLGFIALGSCHIGGQLRKVANRCEVTQSRTECVRVVTETKGRPSFAKAFGSI